MSDFNYILVGKNKQYGQFIVGYADSIATAELVINDMWLNNTYPSQYGRPETIEVYPKNKVKRCLILD